MKYKFDFFLLAGFVLFFSIYTYAGFYNGDTVLQGSSTLSTKTQEMEHLELRVTTFVENGIKYRSKGITAWKVVLKDKKGKVLDSFY